MADKLKRPPPPPPRVLFIIGLRRTGIENWVKYAILRVRMSLCFCLCAVKVKPGLSNDDSDGNKNSKQAVGLFYHNINAFLYIS